MFGWGKKNKNAEAEDAFGRTEQTTSDEPVTSTEQSTTNEPTTGNVTVTATAKTEGFGSASPADLGDLIGAVHAAMDESGGDPDKLREEIQENLAEHGIVADVQSSDSPTTVFTSGFGAFGETAAPEDVTLARLEKLGQLKAQGLLTEEEFATQKARILGVVNASAGTPGTLVG